MWPPFSCSSMPVDHYPFIYHSLFCLRYLHTLVFFLTLSFSFFHLWSPGSQLLSRWGCLYWPFLLIISLYVSMSRGGCVHTPPLSLVRLSFSLYSRYYSRHFTLSLSTVCRLLFSRLLWQTVSFAQTKHHLKWVVPSCCCSAQVLACWCCQSLKSLLFHWTTLTWQKITQV